MDFIPRTMQKFPVSGESIFKTLFRGNAEGKKCLTIGKKWLARILS
jgi:hypothetical protein